MLAEYERIFAGCAERLVAMAESQLSHRQGLESTVVRGNVAAEKRGQWMAFVCLCDYRPVANSFSVGRP